MRTSVFVSIILLSVGLAACAGHTATLGQNGGEVDLPPVDSLGWVAHLEPMGDYLTLTGIFGEVHVGPGAKPGNSHATVSLVGAPVGAELPWMIRSGRCGDVDSRDLGLTSAYRWVDIRGDGTGSLQVELPSLVLDGESHVEVFAGGTRIQDLVACGELEPILTSLRPTVPQDPLGSISTR